MSPSPKPHRTFRTTASRPVPLTPDQARDLIASPATWPEWQPEIVSTTGPERVDQGDTVIGRADLLGFRVRGRADIGSTSPNSLEQDVIVGIGMTVRYEVGPHAEGSVITHDLTCELPGGPAGRILAFFLKRRLKHMQRRLLEQLATR